MAVLEIKTYPENILKQKADQIEVITPQIEKLTENMIKTMRAASGVGLAGPQVGQGKRIFIADPDSELKKPLVFINPEIIKREGRIISEEGCLSLPGIGAKVPRAERVILRAQNIKGKQIEIRADGLLACIIQHEFDHLDGVLFIDRLGFFKKRLVMRKYKNVD
ncbi:MAG: peptide deformylase [Candidatus Omnitrophica bacterium]|nr:peptide deformylase [Candidatus Omnitrophota bacterium]